MSNEKNLELPLTKDGEPVVLHGSYYGEDGKRWHVCATNGTYVYAYKALNEPPVTDDGQMLKRLKPKWLSRKKPDNWEIWRCDAIGLIYQINDIPWLRGRSITQAVIEIVNRALTLYSSDEEKERGDNE